MSALHAALNAAWRHAAPETGAVSGANACMRKDSSHSRRGADEGGDQEQLLLNVVGPSSQTPEDLSSDERFVDSKSNADDTTSGAGGLIQMPGFVSAASRLHRAGNEASTSDGEGNLEAVAILEV
jgi:hypothetical protein